MIATGTNEIDKGTNKNSSDDPNDHDHDHHGDGGDDYDGTFQRLRKMEHKLPATEMALTCEPQKNRFNLQVTSSPGPGRLDHWTSDSPPNLLTQEPIRES